MLRKILRKILGLEKKPDLSWMQYVDNKGSIIRDSFRLRLDNPISGKKYVHLGKDNILHGTIVFESDEGVFQMGNESNLSAGATVICRENITIEDNVFVSWGCTICDHGSHSLYYMDRRDDFQVFLDNVKNNQNLNFNKDWDTVDVRPIRICSDAWIGMNTVICQGVTIGRGAIIGANSVIRKDVPDFTIVAGNPAVEIAKLPKM